MNDRDQARAELAELIAEELGHCIDLGFVEEPLHVMLDHPDLVLRALGMEQVGVTCLSCGFVGRPDDCGCGFDMRHKPVWVEPPEVSDAG